MPEAAQSGSLILNTKSGKQVSIVIETLKPLVGSYNPSSIPAGESLLINGQNLDLVASVTFGGGQTVAVSSSSASQLSVSVPMEAETGNIVLNMYNGETVEGPSLTVTKPQCCYVMNLPEKVDAGAEYLITQIFFDNNYYYRLVKEARKRGITVPILAGIMPITNSKSLLHTAKMCGCSIPYQLSTMIESYYDYPEAMKEIGINYATHQIIDLITNGVDGIHIYTMNKPDIAKAIFNNIPTVLKELNHE